MSSPKVKCIFLDRDGVLNDDRDYYNFKLSELVISEGVPEALKMFKSAGYLLIVVTNQAGIDRGLYKAEDVLAIHEAMQQASDYALDDIYFAHNHPQYSGESLSRKPDSLMLEKAMAKYNIDSAQSWMIGDMERDMQAGKKAGVRTVQIVAEPENSKGDFAAVNLLEAAKLILQLEN